MAIKSGYFLLLDNVCPASALICFSCGAVGKSTNGHLRDLQRYARSSLSAATLNTSMGQKASTASSTQQFTLEFSQVVFLKVTSIPKEELIGPVLLPVLILDGVELKRANAIGNLGETIAPGRGVTINDGFLRRHIFEGVMQRLGYQLPPVVAINLDPVELSKMVEVVQQIDCQIPSDALDNAARGAGIFVELGLLIRENGISKRQVLSEDTESGEVSFASLYIHALVVIMAVQQRGQMQQDVIQPLSAQRVEVAPLKLLSSIPLVMKNQGDQVILRLSSRVAGLIDEDREFTHCKRTPDTKNAGGKPPAGGSPPSLEDHFFIPQPVVVIPVYQKANICSTHRKVA